MQNQLQTEDAQTLLTTPIVASNVDLVTEEMAETQTTQAVERWLAEMRRRIRRSRIGYFAIPVAAIGGIPLVGILLKIFLLSGIDSPTMLRLFFVGIMAVVPMITMVLMQVNRLSLDVEALTRLGGVKAVGPLLEALQAVQPLRQRKQICEALTFLLPQMKASDAALLDARHRGILNSHLYYLYQNKTGHNSYPDFSIAVLKALEQVGDANAVPAVEQLANMKTRNSNLLKVKEAANECLPALRANCGKVEATKTLLRASQSEASVPETLLRPASGAGETAPHDLLRPANSDTPAAL